MVDLGGGCHTPCKKIGGIFREGETSGGICPDPVITGVSCHNNSCTGSSLLSLTRISPVL